MIDFLKPSDLIQGNRTACSETEPLASGENALQEAETDFQSFHTDLKASKLRSPTEIFISGVRSFPSAQVSRTRDATMFEKSVNVAGEGDSSVNVRYPISELQSKGELVPETILLLGVSE